MKDLIFFIIQNLLIWKNFGGLEQILHIIFIFFFKEKSFSSFFLYKNNIFSLNVLFINIRFSLSIKTPSQNLNKLLSFSLLSSPKVVPSLPLQILKLNHLFVDIILLNLQISIIDIFFYVLFKNFLPNKMRNFHSLLSRPKSFPFFSF